MKWKTIEQSSNGLYIIIVRGEGPPARSAVTLRARGFLFRSVRRRSRSVVVVVVVVVAAAAAAAAAGALERRRRRAATTARPSAIASDAIPTRRQSYVPRSHAHTATFLPLTHWTHTTDLHHRNIQPPQTSHTYTHTVPSPVFFVVVVVVFYLFYNFFFFFRKIVINIIIFCAFSE